MVRQVTAASVINSLGVPDKSRTSDDDDVVFMSDVDSVSESSDESWDGDDEIVPTSTSSAATDNQTVTPVRNLLHVLKAPLRSALSRKRKVASNPPRGKRRKICGSSSSDPKNVTPR